MYAYEINRINEDTIAAEMEEIPFFPPHDMIGWLGRNSTSCLATAMGPFLDLLLHEELQMFYEGSGGISAPISPGDVNPTCAFMFTHPIT